MMLTGLVPWQNSDSPLLTLSLPGRRLVGDAAAAFALGRLVQVPPVIVAVAITVAAFTVDAALGAVLQSGSMLNSRPIFGLRWYGFGNVTFAAYATTGLFLAGYLAHRCWPPVSAGRR